MNRQNHHNQHEVELESPDADPHSASRPITVQTVDQPQIVCGEDPCHQLKLRLQQGELLVINPRRKNGLIIYKTYHAEFAGPGAIIGGQFDLDVSRLLAVGVVDNVKFEAAQGRLSRRRARSRRSPRHLLSVIEAIA